MCSKMSGKMTTYINKTELAEILHHLGSPASMAASECSTPLDSQTNEIQVFLGGTDEDQEGVFTTWYSRQLIEVGREMEVRDYLMTCSTCPGAPTDLTMTGSSTTA